MSVEKQRIKLGFVALCDAAPMIVARELGFFAEQGLDVELSREASWASIRDKVAVGVLDGAHMLAPMPISASLGLGNCRTPVITALALSTRGNAITVSRALFDRMVANNPAAMTEWPLKATTLKAVIDADRAAGRRPLCFAVVYPFSGHTYELRSWMADAGIDPDRDVRLRVVPPAQMVANLSVGNIDGYCVGEPWNALAAQLGLGRVLITSREIWAGRIEKVFGVRESWADEHPQTHKAILKALLLAGQWIDQAENRAEVAELLSQRGCLNVSRSLLQASFGDMEALVFHRYAASFPWRSQALWYLRQMDRWGQLLGSVDARRAADRIYRADIYRLAALELGLPVPLTDAKIEGAHRAPWTFTEATHPIEMAPDAFFDGSVFDPDAFNDEGPGDIPTKISSER